jgi:hypothetical protein
MDLSIINLYRYSEFEGSLVRATEIVDTSTVESEFETACLSNSDYNSNKIKLFECERENEQIEDKKKIVEFMVSKNG